MKTKIKLIALAFIASLNLAPRIELPLAGQSLRNTVSFLWDEGGEQRHWDFNPRGGKQISQFCEELDSGAIRPDRGVAVISDSFRRGPQYKLVKQEGGFKVVDRSTLSGDDKQKWNLDQRPERFDENRDFRASLEKMLRGEGYWSERLQRFMPFARGFSLFTRMNDGKSFLYTNIYKDGEGIPVAKGPMVEYRSTEIKYLMDLIQSGQIEDELVLQDEGIWPAAFSDLGIRGIPLTLSGEGIGHIFREG